MKCQGRPSITLLGFFDLENLREHQTTILPSKEVSHWYLVIPLTLELTHAPNLVQCAIFGANAPNLAQMFLTHHTS